MQKRKKTKRLIIFAVINIMLLLCCVFFKQLWAFGDKYLPLLSHCVFNEYCHIYCFGCGMTRALNSLIHFDFLAALMYNPGTVFVVFGFAYYDIKALINIIKGKESVVKVCIWFLLFLLFVFVVYGIARDILLICFKVDWIGDLVTYWK